jgi:hypothetical protein
MALNGSVHINSRYAVLLAPLTISVAVGATASTPITGLGGMKYLVVEAKFLYGAGGTDAIARIQTSLDGGVSWFDIMALGFLTAAANKVAAVSATIPFDQDDTAPVNVPVAVTDGTMTVNTCLNGILGDRIRVKYVTTGTYSGATSLAVYAHAKG